MPREMSKKGSESEEVNKLSAATEQLQKQIAELGENLAKPSTKHNNPKVCWGCKQPGHIRTDKSRVSHNLAGYTQGAGVKGN